MGHKTGSEGQEDREKIWRCSGEKESKRAVNGQTESNRDRGDQDEREEGRKSTLRNIESITQFGDTDLQNTMGRAKKNGRAVYFTLYEEGLFLLSYGR